MKILKEALIVSTVELSEFLSENVAKFIFEDATKNIHNS